MEIYQLKTFVTVANEAHLTRAAERLNTSQPAVSAHIKALEESLGTLLFQRTPKGMLLTEEGRVLKGYAEKILDAKETMMVEAQRLRQELTGTLRIGLNSDPTAQRKAGPFVTWLQTHHPGLNLEYRQSVSGKILLDIKAGNLDGGYFYGSCPHPEISARFITEVEIVVAGPAPWADAIEGAPWKTIAALPWVGFPADCPFTEALSPLFATAEARPGIAMISDNEATITTMVQSGIGLSVMLKEKALEARAEGKLAIWDGAPLSLPLSFATLKKREEEPIIQGALQGVRAVFGQEG